MSAGSGSRFYRTLVRLLLPRDFRRRHEDELVRVFRNLLEEARRDGGPRALLRVWTREVVGLPRLAWRLRRGGGERVRGNDTTRPRTGGGEMMGTLLSETRFAVRALRAQPGLTALVVLTLALGIGANTAIFSVVNGAFLNPLSYAEPHRVMYLAETREEDSFWSGLAYGNYLDLQERAGTLEAVALFVGNSVAVTGGGERPERIRGMFVNADYFRVVGVRPALGRAIQPGEDGPGGDRVVVLSHGFWQSRFGGDPDVLGRTITLNNRIHTVVGVMPRDFRAFWDQPAAWISLHTSPRSLDASNRSAKEVPAMALLREGAGRARAREELSGIMAGLREAHPGNEGWRLVLEPVVGLARDRQGALLLSLSAAVALVLLVACANLANLQLARVTNRSREMAIRAALGGSRRRIAGAALAENLVLALLGGGAGIGLAYLGVEGLIRLNPGYGIYYDVRPDGVVLGFALLLSLATGVLFGLAPAFRAAGADVMETLREGGRGGSGGPGSRRFRNALVVGQVAVTVVLLVGAGLLVRSMQELASVDVGFETESLLTMEFRLAGERYDGDEEQIAFFRELLPRVKAIPGVVAVGSAHGLPFSGNGGSQPIVEEGQPVDDLDAYPTARRNEVSPGYFEAMGIPVLAGRSLRPTDRRGEPVVAVVSQALVDQVWGNRDALGRRVYISEAGDVATVVGVVGSVRRSLEGSPQPELYLSVYQEPDDFASLAIRTRGEPMAVADQVQEAVWSVDPDQPVWEVMPITDRIGSSMGQERFFTVLLGGFSLVGLLLACVGIYGVLAYTVSQRSREIGVRVALGAQGGGIVRMVLGQGMALVGVGLVLGLVGAVGATRLLRSFLFGVGTLDPGTFLVVPALVALVALLASYLPARRATRLDPVEALQEA